MKLPSDAAQLLAGLPVAAMALDRDLGVMWANDEAEALLERDFLSASGHPDPFRALVGHVVSDHLHRRLLRDGTAGASVIRPQLRTSLDVEARLHPWGVSVVLTDPPTHVRALPWSPGRAMLTREAAIRAAAALDTDCSGVFSIERDCVVLVSTWTRGPERQHAPGLTIPMAPDGLMSRLSAAAHALTIPHAKDQPSLASWPYASYALAPIQAGDTLAGALMVGSLAADAFDDAALATLTPIADHLGAELHRLDARGAAELRDDALAVALLSELDMAETPRSALDLAVALSRRPEPVWASAAEIEAKLDSLARAGYVHLTDRVVGTVSWRSSRDEEDELQ